MDLLLVKVTECKVIPLVRSFFIAQNSGPYNRDSHFVLFIVLYCSQNRQVLSVFAYMPANERATPSRTLNLHTAG